MSNYFISSGSVSSGIILNTHDRMTVFCGGTANDTTVNQCGEFIVMSGGMVNNTMVACGGGFFVSSGGMVNNTTVASGGGVIVSGGGMANNMVVADGGFLFVFSGGMANNVSSHALFQEDDGPLSVESGSIPADSFDAAGNEPEDETPGEDDFSANHSHVEGSRTIIQENSSFPFTSVVAAVPRSANMIVRPFAAHHVDSDFGLTDILTDSDLTRCLFPDPVKINQVIMKINPLMKESDRLQVVSLFYAINTGKSLSSVVYSLGFRGSSGQFGYYKRIVNLLQRFSLRLEIVRDTGDVDEEIAAAGIDGFEYRNLNTLKMYRYFEGRIDLRPQDVTHLVSFLYSVARRKLMPQYEYENFEHGPTTQQYGYYHRSIAWLKQQGYRIAVRKM